MDIAKNVFQVHGIDAAEKIVVRKQLRRGQVMKFFEALPPCVVGMEACATAHYWARELTKLGHEVRLMPAKDVKAYVKRNKNDAADAEAICEAVGHPTMRFVGVKSAEQQCRLMQHRARDLLLRQRTQVINALRPLVDENSLVEPLVAVLMRALAAAGRLAEALDCYTTTRRRLDDELGITPGPQLQALHQAIMCGNLDQILSPAQAATAIEQDRENDPPRHARHRAASGSAPSEASPPGVASCCRRHISP